MIGLVFAAVIHADVLISAGHEGRPASCARFHRACNLGAKGERQWTPIVADEATRVLRREGFSVAREPADFAGTYDVDAAAIVHFDGASPRCSSGASIGYPHGAASHALATLWRKRYEKNIPFPMMPDNFTGGLRAYYAYRQIHARDGVVVLELGEITCPYQRAWMAPRLRMLGDAIAALITQAIRRGPPARSAKNGGNASSPSSIFDRHDRLDRGCNGHSASRG